MYLDNPPVRQISGKVIREDTGAALANAYVHFGSGRKPFSLVPIDTFGDEAVVKTNANGEFSLTAKLNARVTINVESRGVFQRFTLAKFPPSNRLDGVVIKLPYKEQCFQR